MLGLKVVKPWYVIRGAPSGKLDQNFNFTFANHILISLQSRPFKVVLIMRWFLIRTLSQYKDCLSQLWGFPISHVEYKTGLSLTWSSLYWKDYIFIVRRPPGYNKWSLPKNSNWDDKTLEFTRLGQVQICSGQMSVVRLLVIKKSMFVWIVSITSWSSRQIGTVDREMFFIVFFFRLC